MREGGYPTLYDGVSADELIIRRVSMFGLRRVETEWARELIRQKFLSESEFMVRVIAQEAFLAFEAGLQGPQAIPTPDQITWIVRWAEARDLNMARGQRAEAIATQMLNDKLDEIRQLGAIALGQMGIVRAVKPLYDKLQDPSPAVREAAFRALSDIQVQLGESLTDPY
jgi:HEAT repeat protein